MEKLVKVSIYLMLVALFIQLLPTLTMAQEETLDPTLVEAVLLNEVVGEEIEVYEDEETSIAIGSIPDDSIVTVLEVKQNIALIEYSDRRNTTNEILLSGYVNAEVVYSLSDAEDIRTSRLVIASEDDSINDQAVHENIELEETSDGEIEISQESEDNSKALEKNEMNIESNNSTQDKIPSDKETDADQMKEENDHELIHDYSVKASRAAAVTFSLASTSVEQLKGVALREGTTIYASTSKSSEVLKIYQQGHILLFKPYNSNWYSATVYVNGVKHSGFIDKEDVDLLIESKPIEGYALKQSVNVYMSPTRNSVPLKSYQLGHKLKFHAFSSQWHKATVYISGKPHTGYIYASDVGDKDIQPSVKLKGIAISNVSVYSSLSKDSNKLKTYNQGSILIYRPYNTSWYSATVYINGKAHEGYIHANEVETAVTTPNSIKGLGKLNSTKIYAQASTNSQVLKSYRQGHILQYRTFTKEWYEATVYVNGKAQIGYLHANHVEEITNHQTSIVGVATKYPTKVYSLASSSSNVLKSYSFASKLIYRTFSDNWYSATVYINGKPQTGYIHKQDVATFSTKSIVIDPGHGGKDPGAIGIGIVEKELTLDIALRVEKLLQNAGATVILTRKDDTFIELSERAKIANTSLADIFISIHGNSFNGIANGVETFWYGKYEKQNSIRLANALQNRVVSSLTSANRRVAEGNFHVIRETKIPSALVEVGFIDHPGNAAKLRLSSYRQRAAEGIFLGVIDYFNNNE